MVRRADLFESEIIQVGMVLRFCKIGHLAYKVCSGLVVGVRSSSRSSGVGLETGEWERASGML